ncbi:MAG: FtsX-like permease family protein [Candidatus Marinimicrobia bacterium]|nr:FtsX-like permease family protein [Candidatus Neomarinimicrobiota bacterium]
MVTLKLALKNILGAGLRTWLNVIILSIAFVAIIFTQGFIEGMGNAIVNDMQEMLYGGGQYWHEKYDPQNPLTIDGSHGELAPKMKNMINNDKMVPILIRSGSIYVNGNSQVIQIKGIKPEQNVIELPSEHLNTESEYIPAILGSRMADKVNLKENDQATIRWRDKDGTFDAADIEVVHIMHTSVQAIDNGQIWISISKLRSMMELGDEATLTILPQGIEAPNIVASQWLYKSPDVLLQDIQNMLKTKTAGSMFMYIVLLAMGLLAIFDTQVLAIFRRKKEIGTLIALGMTRRQTILLFTIEGALHGVLGLIVGAVYGIPAFAWIANKGIKLPDMMDQFGFALSARLYPSFGLKLLLMTTLLVLGSVTIVSFLPTRRIARLEPTEALQGRGK